MQIRKKWPNQLKNFLTNIFENIIWHLFAGCENHCNLLQKHHNLKNAAGTVMQSRLLFASLRCFLGGKCTAQRIP
jgi:hypothetical protein